jgi:hypothetical protein
MKLFRASGLLPPPKPGTIGLGFAINRIAIQFCKSAGGVIRLFFTQSSVVPTLDFLMPVRIAYLILAHRAPWQLKRLVDRLRGPDVHIVLHLDANTSGPEWELLFRELDGPGITWAPRVACRWGDFTLVDATLNCINALANLDDGFDFVVLLSGQDYPIKPRSFVSDFLGKRRGECLMLSYPFPFPYWAHGGYHRLPTWTVNFRGKLRRIFPPQLTGFRHKKVPMGYRPYGGSQWWCLPGSAIRYIREFVRAHPEFVDYYRQAIIPDEMFFHTILGNSHFHLEAGENCVTYMKWNGGPNPVVLTARDLEGTKDSEYMFARKFDMDTDPEIFDWVDRELLGMEPAADDRVRKYYGRKARTAR